MLTKLDTALPSPPPTHTKKTRAFRTFSSCEALNVLPESTGVVSFLYCCLLRHRNATEGRGERLACCLRGQRCHSTPRWKAAWFCCIRVTAEGSVVDRPGPRARPGGRFPGWISGSEPRKWQNMTARGHTEMKFPSFFARTACN